VKITRKRIEAEAEAMASELVGLFALRAGCRGFLWGEDHER
jgi:hypothetical protein